MKKLFLLIILFISNQNHCARTCHNDEECIQKVSDEHICIGATEEEKGICRRKCKIDADCLANQYCKQEQGREHCSLRPNHEE